MKKKNLGHFCGWFILSHLFNLLPKYPFPAYKSAGINTRSKDISSVKIE
jgi:hypothetical protein